MHKKYMLRVKHKGEHIGLLAPLVTARKGYYTDLAKWAQGKGYTHLKPWAGTCF